MNHHGINQFKPNTTVAAIVFCQNKFLLVEEKANNQTVYNQPAGHLEANESLIDAVKRELFEETGVVAEPEYLSGIYYYRPPQSEITYLRFCFVFHLDAWPKLQPQDTDIIAAHWFDLTQIKALAAAHRSPLVQHCIDDYIAGQKIPLSVIKTLL
jgi:phosphatase NudJ